LKELEEEKLVRIACQKSEAQTLIQYQVVKAECEKLKQELKSVKEQSVITHNIITSFTPLVDWNIILNLMVLVHQLLPHHTVLKMAALLYPSSISPYH
jgi:hypothetical protein